MRPVQVAWNALTQKVQYSRDGGRRWKNLSTGGDTPPPSSVSRSVYTYEGGPLSCNNGSFRTLNVDTLVSGDELLDISNPGQPVILESGLYHIEAELSTSAVLTSGGYVLAYLQDESGDQVRQTSSHVDITNGLAVSVDATFDLDVEDNSYFVIGVGNFDGTTARSFIFNRLAVTKLS